MFYVPANPFNVNVVCDGCPVHQPFVTHLTAAVIKLAEMQKNLALKKLKSMLLCMQFLATGSIK